jgi:hypothetical protein
MRVLVVASSMTLVSFLNRYVECIDPFYTQEGICANLTICVTVNTTNYAVVEQTFPGDFLAIDPSSTSRTNTIAEAFVNGECNIVAGGLSEVYSAIQRLQEAGEARNFNISSLYAKSFIEPLALVTRHDDAQWSDFVYAIVMATFYAEENGITMSNAMIEMPELYHFGQDYTNMLRNAVGVVGSYSEIYERNVEAVLPRSGLNRLFQTNTESPLLFPVQDLLVSK